ncbi:hypothetical protein PHMEG_0005286 [Phytophthora megakarya]|uniref:Reverse transcriptase n=1 Tax=Phytophthora megakarya TaxID=4795 RepID=A0A225WRL5_9STRA|nr:hypothetical protein PHMEG_0005286 [Phytophthora megakarya]
MEHVKIPVLHTPSNVEASTSRPSTMEKLVHEAVVHPSLLRKNAQFVIESAQQGPRTTFLPTPPLTNSFSWPPPTLMMLDDVSGAFRHIPLAADPVHMFGFGLNIIPFGWCVSPAYYLVAGSVIDNLYQNQQPERSLAPLNSSRFSGNIWCDGHTCIEVSTGTRRAETNWGLCKAMTMLRGPTLITEAIVTE